MEKEGIFMENVKELREALEKRLEELEKAEGTERNENEIGIINEMLALSDEEIVKRVKVEHKQLSEEELDNVAGGRNDPDQEYYYGPNYRPGGMEEDKWPKPGEYTTIFCETCWESFETIEDFNKHNCSNKIMCIATFCFYKN